MAGASSGSEIYFEFLVQGASVRVTAIHGASGVEAVILGPANAPRATLEAAALRKLQYVLKRKRGEP
ncbi:MAG: hypothetical protein GC166_05495 [Alphaproteobacteria bacterium]|nr:hypothetical protein [Alphaproteobacteria bacterium]